jgi:hypothetical protein
MILQKTTTIQQLSISKKEINKNINTVITETLILNIKQKKNKTSTQQQNFRYNLRIKPNNNHKKQFLTVQKKNINNQSLSMFQLSSLKILILKIKSMKVEILTFKITTFNKALIFHNHKIIFTI